MSIYREEEQKVAINEIDRSVPMQRRGLRKRFYLVVAFIVTVTMAASLTTFAHADENGLLEDSGLLVETSGIGNGDVSTALVDVDFQPAKWGFETDFNDLREEFGIASDQLSNNVGPADMDSAITDAVNLLNTETGFDLNDPDDTAQFRTEAINMLTAYQGYLDSGPVNEDPTARSIVDVLDTMLPILDDAAPCRGRCLDQGTLRVFLINSIFSLIGFVVSISQVSDLTKNAVTGSMLVLGIIVTGAQLIRSQWAKASSAAQQQFLNLGIFTSLNNVVSLISQSAAIAIDAVGGTNRFGQIAGAAAQAVVNQGGGGTPAAGATAIDIHDEL